MSMGSTGGSGAWARVMLSEQKKTQLKKVSETIRFLKKYLRRMAIPFE